MYKKYLSIFPSLLLSLFCFSQNSTKEEINSWYDNQTGIENSSLYRGIEYVEEHRMINEKHKFFKSEEFKKGSLTYDGQSYHNVPLKFNIYEDLLLVNLQQGQRNSFFQLFSNKVNNFQINNHKFRYLKAENNSGIQGFYEVISEEGELEILKKHRKQMKELRDKNVAYIEFRTVDPDYIFQFDDEFYDLDNRRDLISKFPGFRNEIRGFYSKNRKQSREDRDTFMKNLAKEMNSLFSTATNEIKE